MSRDDWAPAIPGGRCAMPRRDAELQDTWLTPNGVDGFLTEHAVITIHNGEITYAAWLHTDGSCTVGARRPRRHRVRSESQPGRSTVDGAADHTCAGSGDGPGAGPVRHIDAHPDRGVTATVKGQTDPVNTHLVDVTGLRLTDLRTVEGSALALALRRVLDDVDRGARTVAGWQSAI